MEKKIFILILLASVATVGYYWFDYRPIQIRKRCTVNAEAKKEDYIRSQVSADSNPDDRNLIAEQEEYDKEYKACLKRYWVKK